MEKRTVRVLPSDGTRTTDNKLVQFCPLSLFNAQFVCAFHEKAALECCSDMTASTMTTDNTRLTLDLLTEQVALTETARATACKFTFSQFNLVDQVCMLKQCTSSTQMSGVSTFAQPCTSLCERRKSEIAPTQCLQLDQG